MSSQVPTLPINIMATPSSTPNSCQTSVMSTNKRASSHNSNRPRQSSLSNIQPFRPYPGNPLDPIDICIDNFFNSPTFELMCIQAIQLATVLPCTPPPTGFISFEATPMHQWYQALLMDFTETFMRRLRLKNQFPVIYKHSNQDSVPTDNVCDNEETFNHEATAHINAILTSFNLYYTFRGCGSTQYLAIDLSQPNATVAALALQETVAPAEYAPKRNWRVGELLHAEYRRRLRMFEAGVTRLMAERDESRWILGLPDRLRRGIDAYKEHYIACLREEIVGFRAGGDMDLHGELRRGGAHTDWDTIARNIGSVRDEDDVFI